MGRLTRSRACCLLPRRSCSRPLHCSSADTLLEFKACNGIRLKNYTNSPYLFTSDKALTACTGYESFYLSLRRLYFRLLHEAQHLLRSGFISTFAKTSPISLLKRIDIVCKKCANFHTCCVVRCWVIDTIPWYPKLTRPKSCLPQHNFFHLQLWQCFLSSNLHSNTRPRNGMDSTAKTSSEAELCECVLLLCQTRLTC